MDARKDIFENYLKIRGSNIDNKNVLKEQERFNNIIKNNYLPHIRGKKIDSMLEIGSYKGFTLKFFKEKKVCRNIEGIDLSEDAVDFSKKYTGLSTIYKADLFEYLPKNKEKYDLIIMKAVLEHIPKKDILKTIKLIHSSLKKGGIALIAVPNMDWISATHERYMDFTHEVGFTKESLYDVCKLVFEDVTIKPLIYDFPTSPLGLLRKKLLTPLIKYFVKTIFILLAQGAYNEYMFDRSIIAILKK